MVSTCGDNAKAYTHLCMQNQIVCQEHKQDYIHKHQFAHQCVDRSIFTSKRKILQIVEHANAIDNKVEQQNHAYEEKKNEQKKGQDKDIVTN